MEKELLKLLASYSAEIITRPENTTNTKDFFAKFVDDTCHQLALNKSEFYAARDAILGIKQPK
jgi:hypothetical protein